jgi:hypothetical protein
MIKITTDKLQKYLPQGSEKKKNTKKDQNYMRSL